MFENAKGASPVLHKVVNSSRLSQIGILATLLYFVAVAIALGFMFKSGWLLLEPVELNQLGDLLAGLFGPIAIFWLILSFFQQGEELRHSVDALRLQAEELRASVAQQKSMVEVAQNQLQLDIEVREEQTRLFVSSELPLFQLEPTGGIGRGNGQMVWSFLLRNVGADATTYTIAVDGGDQEFSDRHLNFLQTDQHYEFSLIKSGSAKTNTENWAKVTVSSNNKRNWSRTQTFGISSSQQVTPISTDPPTN